MNKENMPTRTSHVSFFNITYKFVNKTGFLLLIDNFFFNLHHFMDLSHCAVVNMCVYDYDYTMYFITVPVASMYLYL